jgi:uncharacterized OB-fold protein
VIESTAETEHFWSELREGRLVGRRCLNCRAAHPYPRRFCIVCGSEDGEWVNLPDEATIYSFTEVSAAPSDRPYLPSPFTLLVVEFDDGRRLMALFDVSTGVPPTIGKRVRFKLWTHDAVVLPAFAPVNEAVAGGVESIGGTA